MKKNVQKWILLSLSLILITAYSVSAALPAMADYYAAFGYQDDAVDLLISVSSFGVMLVVIANILFSRYFNERVMIISGLILFTVSGTVPAFVSAYPVVLACRLLMGIGSGMVNAKAISVLSCRYQGEECARLLGIRSSVESLGGAVLTFIAGFLLTISWQRTFLIYLLGLPVLIVYLIGMPRGAQQQSAEKIPSDAKWTFKDLMTAIPFALGGFLMISTNTVVSMCLGDLFLERGIGTATAASTLLSLMICANIVSGILYGPVRALLKDWLIPVMLLASTVTLAIVCISSSFWVIAIMLLLFGLTYAGVVVGVFNGVPDSLPTGLIDRATSLVLVGCNLGAFLATYFIKLAGVFSDSAAAGIAFMTILTAIASVLLLILRMAALIRKKRA